MKHRVPNATDLVVQTLSNMHWCPHVSTMNHDSIMTQSSWLHCCFLTPCSVVSLKSLGGFPRCSQTKTWQYFLHSFEIWGLEIWPSMSSYSFGPLVDFIIFFHILSLLIIFYHTSSFLIIFCHILSWFLHVWSILFHHVLSPKIATLFHGRPKRWRSCAGASLLGESDVVDGDLDSDHSLGFPWLMMVND